MIQPLREIPYRVLVVDDHPIVREGLSALLGLQPDLRVTGQAEGAASALVQVAHEPFDLALVDLSLGQDSGLVLIKDLHAVNPALKLLALSMHDQLVYAERALRAGASGYVMKHEAPDVLLGAMRAVLAGEIFLSAPVSAQLLRSWSPGARPTSDDPAIVLSERQLEVFRLLGRGMGSKEIAQLLGVSVKTIEAHRAHIKEKLQIGGASELVACAARWVAVQTP